MWRHASLDIAQLSYHDARGPETPSLPSAQVSMPTGTLCAERNAIGNALAGDQTMCRSDMKGVAVLSIPLNVADDKDDFVGLNPLDPCGACMEWLKKIAEVETPRHPTPAPPPRMCMHIRMGTA